MHLIALTPCRVSHLTPLYTTIITPTLHPLMGFPSHQGKPAPATIWWEVCRLVGVERFHLARLPVPKPLTASDIVRRTCWVLQREADVGRQDEELPGQANQIHWSVCILSCNPWPSSSPRWSPDSSQVEWWVVSRNDFFCWYFYPLLFIRTVFCEIFPTELSRPNTGRGWVWGENIRFVNFFFFRVSCAACRLQHPYLTHWGCWASGGCCCFCCTTCSPSVTAYITSDGRGWKV